MHFCPFCLRFIKLKDKDAWHSCQHGTLVNRQGRKGFMELRISRLQKSNIEDVQKIMDSSPSYHRKIKGKPASFDEAQRIFALVPENFDVSDKYCFGLFKDNQLIGFSDILRGYPEANYAYLGLLIFPENLESKGFGRLSYSIIENELLTWPEINRVRLGVATTNDVCGFWEKMGFIKTGKVSRCDQPEVTCAIIEMEKQIRN